MSNNDFQENILTFLNELCAKLNLSTAITADTNLFESKILDSVRFLSLMTFLQADLEIDVPDRMLSTEYFATPRIIATNFGPDAALTRAS